MNDTPVKYPPCLVAITRREVKLFRRNQTVEARKWILERGRGDTWVSVRELAFNQHVGVGGGYYVHVREYEIAGFVFLDVENAFRYWKSIDFDHKIPVAQLKGLLERDFGHVALIVRASIAPSVFDHPINEW